VNFAADQEMSDAQDDRRAVDIQYQEMIASRQAQLDKYQEILQGFKMSQYPTRGTVAPGTSPGTGGGAGGAADPLGVAKLNEDLAKLIATIDPAQVKAEQFTAAMDLLNRAVEAGAIDSEDYEMRVKQLNEAFKEVPGSAGAATSGLAAMRREVDKNTDAAADLADDISGAVGRVIDRIGSGTSTLRQFGLELVKIFAVRGISKLLGGSDWLTGSLFGANALGTDNWRGGMSWVGEKGPELVNLPRGAQVIPNNKIGQMGGSGGGDFVYAPVIDARGASLSAVQELDQRMRADGAQFNQKVIAAVRSGQSKRML